MSVSITVSNGELVSNYELTNDFPMDNLVALVIGELGTESHDPANVRLLKNGRDLLSGEGRTKTLMDVGVVSGDVLLYAYIDKSIAPSSRPSTSSGLSASAISDALKKVGQTDISKRVADLVAQIKVPSSGGGPSRSSVVEEDDKIRKIFEGMQKNPVVKQNVYRQCPVLFEQFNKHPADYDGFKAAYLKWISEEKRKLAAMHDPFSAEGQKLIEKMINQQNIDQTYERAMETMPEAFIPVHMLYIRLKINGTETIAFIDSGAQVSIMSETLAARLGVDRLMDTRFRAMASGVGGHSKFAGRIHACQVQVKDHFFECKFDVLGDRDMDLLIGLDVLRRHHCVIDLARNRLKFGDNTETEFLSDAEIKEHKPENSTVMNHAAVPADKEKVAKLVGMGFAAEEAAEALQKSFNDLDDAVHHLFEKQHEKHDSTQVKQ